MACNTHSTGAIARASIPSNFSRRLALLAAALAPAAALALPEPSPIPADPSDGRLIKAAHEVVAIVGMLTDADLPTAEEDIRVDAALDAYDAIVARLADCGPPETMAGLAMLAQATLAVLHYEVRLYLRQSYEEQARPHELLAAMLAEGAASLAGRASA